MIETLRERWAVLVIVAGAIYSAWVFYARPAVAERAEQEAVLSARTAELDELADRPEDPDAARAASRLSYLLNLRFGEASLIGDQDRLNALAGASGLRINRVEPEGHGASGSYGPLRLDTSRLRVEASGDYDAVARFLSELAQAPAAVVEDVTLRSDRSSNAVALSLRLRTVRVARVSAVAEGTIE